MTTHSTISASGFCAQCDQIHTLPVGNSRAAAYELMQKLETHRTINFPLDEVEVPHQKDPTDPFSTNSLWGNARGQMFGVLECVNSAGETVILKAFSCQFNGQWLLDGWAPPLFDVSAFHDLTEPVYEKIYALTAQLEADSTLRDLRAARADLSRNLVIGIHNLYQLTNLKGTTCSLNEILNRTKGIPIGTGDCCAPKLLNEAARLNLQPVGLSEFYWGKESKSGARQHRQFYTACKEKCQPILGFMLCGSPRAPQPSGPSEAVQRALRLPILYADSDLVMIEKPSGLLSVPGRGTANQDCVVARIRHAFPDCPKHPEVHRLDMDTSGIMVFALNKESHRELSRQFQDRETKKSYIALLDGEIDGESGTIELAFRLDLDNRPQQIYDPVRGKLGTTLWKKLSVEKGQTRVELTPITGRTHQLRLHAASEHGLGAPIVGDRLYGSGTAPGQLKLHACSLSITHPATHKILTKTSKPRF